MNSHIESSQKMGLQSENVETLKNIFVQCRDKTKIIELGKLSWSFTHLCANVFQANGATFCYWLRLKAM